MTISKQVTQLDHANENLYIPSATREVIVLHKENFECEDGTQIKRVITKKNDGDRKALTSFYNSLKK